MPTRGLATELIERVHTPTRPELLEHSAQHAHIVTCRALRRQGFQRIGYAASMVSQTESRS